MKKLLLILGAFLMLNNASFAQTQIYIEDFEDATVDYTYSPASGEFSDGSGDYLGIVGIGGISVSSAVELTGILGSGYLGGQDLDGDGEDGTQTITFDDINISGYESLELRVYLAEDDDASDQDWDAADYVHFTYDVDNTGSFSNLLWIEGSGGTNTAPFIDTDFDGVGDGTEITSTFTQFTANISGSGSTLDLKIEISLDSGDEDIAIDNIEIYGTATGGTATKLAVSSINSSSSPTSGTAFEVVVEAQDGSSTTTAVSGDTDITLAIGSGNGALSGTITGTISSGNTNTTISGVIYTTTDDGEESGVTLSVSDDASGLSSGTSSSFTVLAEATKLVISGFPSSGYSGISIDEFTVEVQRADNSVDLNSTASISVSKNSGSGSLSGTSPVSAEEGVATFSDISFDTGDDYTISVSATGLTGATSGTITIVTAVSPSSGSVFITEVSDATGSFTNDFLELYNSGSDAVTVESSSLVRYNADGTSSEYTYDFSSGGSTILPANGFLIVARGTSDESSFESEWGSLPDNTNLNLGNSNLFFGNGRRWVLKHSGNVIDSTSVSVGNSTRHFQFPVGSQSFTEGIRAEATPGELDGTVEITGDAGWRLLSFPVTDGIITDISEDTPVQGITNGDDSEAGSNFYIYDNSGAWEEPANVTTVFGDGYGFALYFYDNTNNGSTNLPVSLDISGTEPSSDVTIALNKSTTSGLDNHYFTLSGNPFASNYDLNGVTTDQGTLQDNAHFWDGNTYITGDFGTGSFIVAPWQGFWFEVENAGTATEATFPTASKTTSSASATYFKNSAVKKGDINFSLSSEKTIDNAIRLSFREYATEGSDRADASKLVPLLDTYATMAFRSEDLLKSVESLPFDFQNEIELNLVPEVVGIEEVELTFAWEGLESVPAEWKLMLHDKKTGESVDMRTQSEYVFTETGESDISTENVISVLKQPTAMPMKLKGTEDGRFTITINPTIVSNEVNEGPESFSLYQNYPNPFNPTTNIRYSVAESGNVNIAVYNLMGQKVAELVNETKAAGAYNVTWNASQMASGMYYYRLTSSGQTFTRKMTLIK